MVPSPLFVFFFFNDTATTEIYTLSLHDALPISTSTTDCWRWPPMIYLPFGRVLSYPERQINHWRSEEHTSELQSHSDLVCRLLLEKKKRTTVLTAWVDLLIVGGARRRGAELCAE